MRRRWGPLFVMVATAIALTSAPAGAHVRRRNDPADKPGRFDIKQVALDHGRSESCAQRCVEIGIQTHENWSPKLLGGPNSRFRNFYILFGSSKNRYDRYLWIWWYKDHLIASMKDYNGSDFTTKRGRFLGAAAVAKEGNNLAVRFPRRLLRRTRGNRFDLTDQVWWHVVSEFKGKGCRHVCVDFAPRFGAMHTF